MLNLINQPIPNEYLIKNTRPKVLKNEIKFEKVNFNYGVGLKDVIKNISFQLKKEKGSGLLEKLEVVKTH